MALLDKVPGDLKLYIGGYVKYTFYWTEPCHQSVSHASLLSPIPATDMSSVGCSPCAGAMRFNKLTLRTSCQ